MKLGTETNSVVNHVYSRGVIGEPKPEVGMGATLLLWTDRHAATITKVEEIGGSTIALYIIEVTEDICKIVSGSGHDGSAKYEYFRGDGPVDTYRKNKKTGFWEGICKNPATGKWVKINGAGLRIGARDEYCDPSF